MNYRAHRSSKRTYRCNLVHILFLHELRTSLIFFISTIPLAPPRKFVLSWGYDYIDIIFEASYLVLSFEFELANGAPLLRVCRRLFGVDSSLVAEATCFPICACRTRCRLPLGRRIFIIWREYLRVSGGGGHTTAAGFMATRTRFQLRNLERANYLVYS